MKLYLVMEKKKRIESYLLCGEEFKLSKTKYPVTKTIENIGDDGEIHFLICII